MESINHIIDSINTNWVRNKWIVHKIVDIGDCINNATIDDKRNIFYTTISPTGLWKLNSNDNEPKFLAHNSKTNLEGLVWNGSNTIYVCHACDEILQYDIESGKLSHFAGQKERGIDGDNIALDEASFYQPKGITKDAKGTLYITHSHCIRKIKMKVKKVEIYGTHQGHSDRGGRFNHPDGIAVSPKGTIYVCDSWNRCVRMITGRTAATIRPQKSNTKEHFYFKMPHQVYVDLDGSLLVVDEIGLHRMKAENENWQASTMVEGVRSLTLSQSRDLLVLGVSNSMVILQPLWTVARLLWIGKMKEKPADCHLATVPREIIRVIASMICLPSSRNNLKKHTLPEDQGSTSKKRSKPRK